MTPLMGAANRGQTSVVKILLNAGANVNAKDQLWGATALYDAALNEHPEVIQLLIKAGANVNDKDKDDVTELSFASLLSLLVLE